MILSAAALSATFATAGLAASVCEVFEGDAPFRNLVELNYDFSVLDGIVDFDADFRAPGCEIMTYGFSGSLDTATNTGMAVFEELTGGLARFAFEASISRGAVSDASPNAAGELELSQTTPFDLRLDPFSETAMGGFFPNGLTLASIFGDDDFDSTADSVALFEPDAAGGSDDRLTRLLAFRFVTVERNDPVISMPVPAVVPVPAAGLGLVSMLGMLLIGTRRRAGRG